MAQAAPDATLRRFSGYGMKRAFNGIQADLSATLQSFGLRMVTFSALVVIHDNPGLRQTRLAGVLAIERPNLVAILEDLERADLIARTRAETDRRAYELSVTAKGRTLCQQAMAAVVDHDRRMTRGLSADESATLQKLLRRIEGNGRTPHDRRKISRA
jgi:DNA-binding MarR family transcriptional regulator